MTTEAEANAISTDAHEKIKSIIESYKKVKIPRCPKCGKEAIFDENKTNREENKIVLDCIECGKTKLGTYLFKKYVNSLPEPKEPEPSEPFPTCNWCVYYFDKKHCGIANGRSKKEAHAIYEYRGYEICTDFKKDYTKLEKPTIDEALNLLKFEGFIFKVPNDTEEILGYEDGIYKSYEWKIKELLEQNFGVRLTRTFVEEVLGHIQRANYVERENINKLTEKIPLKNGIYNFETRSIEPFDTEQVFTYQLNVEYDPEAKCPKFLEFIKEIQPEENDRKLLQEIIGFCPLPDYRFHKIFWFYGDGRNGKGTIVRTTQAVLGKESYSNIDIEKFYGRFVSQKLYGKLANFSSEPRLSKYGLDTTFVKKATGQDEINAEVKNKNNTLDFTNVAKFIVMGNKFPKVQDDSKGWWERVIVLNFPSSFELEIQDIEERWIPSEISGIFNWMLEGLYRLLENGRFTVSKSAEEMKTEFMKLSDPFQAWIIENCDKIPTAYITRDEAFENYNQYCDDLGQDRDSKNKFIEKMKKEPKVQYSRVRIAGKREYVFQGITIKNDEDPSKNEGKEQVKLVSVPSVPPVLDSQIPESNRKNNFNLRENMSKGGTGRTNGTELEKLENVRNWIKHRLFEGSLHINEVNDKITELKFATDEKTILRKLTDAGDLRGVDVM